MQAGSETLAEQVEFLHIRGEGSVGGKSNDAGAGLDDDDNDDDNDDDILYNLIRARLPGLYRL